MIISHDTLSHCLNVIVFEVDGKVAVEIRQGNDKKEYVFEVYKLPYDNEKDVIKTVKVLYKKTKKKTYRR